MKPERLALAIAAALLCGTSLGQNAAEGERPIRPESASGAAIGGWCDALTGAKKDECLRDERRRREEEGAQRGATPSGCDALPGAERERCLRGNRIEVETASRADRMGAKGADH